MSLYGLKMFSLEGVGDEVVDFFFTVTLVVIGFLAWWTTSLSERPIMQTVFIVERRAARRSQPDLHTIRDVPEPEEVLTEGEELVTEYKPNSESEPVLRINPIHLNGRDIDNNSPPEANAGDLNEELVSEPIDTENLSDSDESLLRTAGLAFFDEGPINSDLFDPFGFGDSDDANTTDENSSEDGSDEEARLEDDEDETITIRLKYLNDDQKYVEGRLYEQLGEFKRRHFSGELNGHKTVRLIFKGQVLQEDTRTLQSCGFFDNCVVHCLIQSRSPPPSPSNSRAHTETRINNNNNTAHWDLGNILFAGLSVLLGVAWYGRFQYAQLYTATTTVTLVGLTGIFTVSLIGMYMPDVDGIRA